MYLKSYTKLLEMGICGSTFWGLPVNLVFLAVFILPGKHIFSKAESAHLSSFSLISVPTTTKGLLLNMCWEFLLLLCRSESSEAIQHRYAVWIKTSYNPYRTVPFGKHPIDMICWRRSNIIDEKSILRQKGKKITASSNQMGKVF